MEYGVRWIWGVFAWLRLRLCVLGVRNLAEAICSKNGVSTFLAAMMSLPRSEI